MAVSTNTDSTMPPGAWRRVGHVAAATGGVAAMLVMSAGASAAAPTCSDSDIVDVAVHGEHVVGDYVTRMGHDVLTWPPAGQVGTAIPDEGPLAGGPGPGFHFIQGIAPGASFCLSQSRSPGYPHR